MTFWEFCDIWSVPVGLVAMSVYMIANEIRVSRLEKRR